MIVRSILYSRSGVLWQTLHFKNCGSICLEGKHITGNSSVPRGFQIDVQGYIRILKFLSFYRFPNVEKNVIKLVDIAQFLW